MKETNPQPSPTPEKLSNQKMDDDGAPVLADATDDKSIDLESISSPKDE